MATAATSGKKLFMITIYGFQSLDFVIGEFAWYVLAAPDLPLLLYFFSVNSILICSEVSFSWGLCCTEPGQLTSVGWCLYDTGGC